MKDIRARGDRSERINWALIRVLYTGENAVLSRAMPRGSKRFLPQISDLVVMRYIH